jgi:MFS family permease
MREFNKLWAGQTVSLVGSALTMFALPSLAVLTLHATAAQIGILSALQLLPFPVLGLVVGVLADRFSRRRMMIYADFVRFAALGGVPLCAAIHWLQMPVLYAVALITGTASVFFGVAYQSYLPVVVSKEQLTDANAKLEFSNSGSQMAGNALGGILVQWLGAVLAIAVDAVSYVVSVVSLFWIRVPEPAHDGPDLTVRQGWLEVREGWRVVFDTPDLRWITFTTGTGNFGFAMVGAVMLIYAYRVLHLEPALLGVVWGIAEIGFVGALLAMPVRRWLGLRRTLFFSAAAIGVSGFVLLPAQLGVPYVLILISAVGMNLTVPIYNVNQISYRQALVDVRLQGRMNATIRTIVWGTMPLGSLAGGWLATLTSIPVTIVTGSALATLAALWLLPLQERPTVREGFAPEQPYEAE